MEQQSFKWQYLPQLIIFLSQHNYQVKGYANQKIDSNFLNNIPIEETKWAVYLSAVKKKLEQNVSIKISYSDLQAYQGLKQEAQTLKKLMYFDCVVQYVEEFDFEDQSIFILITEDFDISLEKMIKDSNTKQKQVLRIEQIVNIFYRLLFQLFELHENNYFHGNINPFSIVVNSNGDYKFRNLLSAEQVFEKHGQVEQEQIDRFYVSPEIKKLSSKWKRNQINDILLALKYADIYCLGLVFLALLDIQINEKVLKQLKKEKFSQIYSMLEKDRIKLFSFLNNYMLNCNPELRVTANQLRKNLFSQYEEVYIFKDKEIVRLKEILQKYEQHRKLSEYYKTFLVCQLVQFELINNKYINIYYSKKQLNNLDKKTYENNHFLLLEMGITYYYFRDFKQHVKYCLKALEIRQQLYPQVHQLVAELLKELGNGYRFIDTNFENSYNYKVLALDMYQQLYNQNHESIAETIKSIGTDFLSFKYSKKAIYYLKRCLEIREFLYVEKHLYITDIFTDLVKCYTYQLDYDKIIFWSLKIIENKSFIYKQIHLEDLDLIFSIILKTKDPHKRLKYNLKLLQQINLISNFNIKIKADVLSCISLNYMEIRDFENAQLYEIQQLNLLKKQ